MLKLAIDAKLPLITIYTDDVVNVGAVLAVVADQSAQPYAPTIKPKIDEGQLYYVQDSDKIDLKLEYQKFSQRKSVLVVVNPQTPNSAAFDAGVLTTPPAMIEKFVQKYGDAEHHDGLMAALAGLSFEQVFQVSTLAMTKHSQYTPRAVRDIRRTFFGTVRGLQMLSTDFLYYYPDPTITYWLKHAGRFLTEFDEPLLAPRGLLFSGPPGTGKTMGAKYIARQLDLPLYHMDIAGLMEKYVGESEKNLRIALHQAEQSAPCIIVIDEVEKLFSTGNDDTGVTSRMLSTILWWLQEHRSRVFTVMTTNKEAAIPPELYREGRIDSEVKFKKLSKEQAAGFATDYCSQLCKALGIEYVPHEIEFLAPHSHADVVGQVNTQVRLSYLKKEGEK